MNRILKGLKFFFELLKYNKLTRLGVSLMLFAIFLKLSEYNDRFMYLAIAFSIYPIWLIIWLFIYAWILNPIRENLPKSWVARKVIPFLDNIIDR